ncbi:MarR family winged helix-turn-helix transcriptional regulator [Pseudacidobacterium ailaaui]|jgi:MarR family 2-MHQ and catechol resistance regulon transcriptional repressor|uniref:MarR family winged helix-turn-helix transcriptional regulator n=1 Tax=Pseudacidobacterium ailaaui TaxID=1382359 RepID=UPI00047DDF50|nr:MarR family transcriptional regulator [Pseudacidobacterium ailaaui]MDI3253314.1 MarR family transcriptional regulator [Bacillota bacterium]
MRPTTQTPTTDASGIHLWLVLWKAFHSVEAHALRSIAGLGMAYSDFGVLEALLHKGPLTIGQLGQKVLLTSGSMTAAINRLETKGLVERRPAVGDGRTRLIALTPKGSSLIQAAFANHRQAMEDAVGGLSIDERKTLVNLLRRLGLSAAQRSKK